MTTDGNENEIKIEKEINQKQNTKEHPIDFIGEDTPIRYNIDTIENDRET